MNNEMAERYDSANYYGMTDGIKTKIVLSLGNTLYMFNLPLMDSSSFGISRRGGVVIKDKDSTKCIYHSAESRIFNGKYGGVPIYEVLLLEDKTLERAHAEKIIYYFKQAILYSKKVKTKKKDMRIQGGY